MELKVIFYILLALGWLVSKALAARQKPVAGAPEKAPVPKSSGPEGSGELSREWREGRSKRNPLMEIRGNGTPRMKLNSNWQKALPVSTDYFEEGGEVQHQDLPEDLIIQSSALCPSDCIADEIRSGQLDWRRQVIITELLTKKYV